MNVSLRRRAPQLHLPVRPGHPLDGYYNDFRLIVRDYGGPDENRRALERLAADRQRANPVSIAQLGLGAWQVRDADPGWLVVVRDVADWLVAEMTDEGLVPYLFPMSHTYTLEPPWTSALAQGETVSLLLRAGRAFGEPAFADAAERAAASLVDATSPLVATTAEGPVLQEYPTDPPAHVLNGWIYALFGLYDLGAASADEGSASRALAAESFRLGCEALGPSAAALPRLAELVALRPLPASAQARREPVLPPPPRRAPDVALGARAGPQVRRGGGGVGAGCAEHRGDGGGRRAKGCLQAPASALDFSPSSRRSASGGAGQPVRRPYDSEVSSPL